MNDYIMLVDENGQPYIAHAGILQKAGNAMKSAVTTVSNTAKGVGRGVRQNHKYLMKVREGARDRYLYTKQEVDAYLRGGRRALQNTANKAAQTVQNTANKAGQTVKNTANKAVETVKDKAGVDEKRRAEEAWNKVPRRVSSDDKEAVEAFRKATEAQKEYRKTPLGAAEYAKERAYEIATGQDGTAKEIAEKVAGKAKEKASEAVDNVKSKYDRMRDEFRDAGDKVSKAVEDVKDKTIDRNKAKYSEYSEDDPDFDEKNYSPSNRVGNTDFFMYTRPDGRTVILKEDMKWVLPESYTPEGSYVNATLKNFPSATEKGWTWEEWKDNVTKEINKAVNKKSKYN